MKFLIILSISIVIFLCNDSRQVDAQDTKIKSEKYTPDEVSKLEKLNNHHHKYFQCATPWYRYGDLRDNSHHLVAHLKKSETIFREIAEGMTENPHMKTNGYLIRFLRAKGLNLVDAKEMLSHAIKWRDENKISSILDENLGQGSDGRSFYTIGDSVDIQGRPVIILEMKKLDVRKYALGAQTKFYLRMWIQMYERIEEAIHENELATGQDIGQAIMISDMSDYNLRQHGCIPCVQLYIENLGNIDKYYPGLIGKAIAVNAPRIFLPNVELIKPLMSPVTREALITFGADRKQWEPELRKIISPEQLPVKFGGTKA